MSCPDTSAIEAAAPAFGDDALTIRALAIPGAHGTLAARLYAPQRDGAADHLIVFFHQGGFIGGSIDEADGFVRALALQCATPVLSSSYTLAGQHAFPAAVEDAHAVLQWAAKRPAELGWNGAGLITAGIEAGGNLAAVAALVARDRGGPRLAGQILIMPMLDPGLSSCSMRALKSTPAVAGVADHCAAAYRDYLPRPADRTHPYASPLQSSRLKDLPPALILCAIDDPLHDEAEQYGAKLAACGVNVLLKHLPPVPLQDGPARCACARKTDALTEIAAFIGGLRCPLHKARTPK